MNAPVTSIAPQDREKAIASLIEHHAAKTPATRSQTRRAVIRAINRFRGGDSADRAVKAGRMYLRELIEKGGTGINPGGAA